MNKMAKEAVEQQVRIFVNHVQPHIWSISSTSIRPQSFQVAVSPSLGSLPSNTVNTTSPNMTHISLTFEYSNGTVLARLDMASNLTLSLASTKCQVCQKVKNASVFTDLYLQGNVIDNFCCSAAVDASKCKGGDKWKYAGMVVKDKVWYP